MKYFLTLSSIMIMTLLSCTSTSTSVEKSVSSIEKISLSEQTRGTNRVFQFRSGQLEISNNGTSSSVELSQNEWSKISEFAGKINPDGISKLEAPSTKRFSDAALASTIIITKNGTEYASSEFDSGNPPAELKNLYDEIQKHIQMKKSK